MASIELPRDFREFLRLLTAHEVEYLLVGGYAVAHHGYPRATQDLDVWVAREATNAELETLDGIQVPVINLADLKTNKRTAGRPKDLDALDNLP
jgi:predicted nucleotidyltransferase